MSDIAGQKLSLIENSMHGLASSIELAARRIDDRLYDMQEIDESLATEMTGNTLTDFRSVAELVEDNILLTRRQLSCVGQEVQSLAESFEQIDDTASQKADAGRN